MHILQAFDDPALFGSTFTGPSWSNWRTILKGIYALPMTAKEAALYAALTGRTKLPANPATEAFIIAGRRSGKSTIAAGIAVFEAIRRDYRPYLAPGAFATIFVVSPDRTQSRIVHRTVRGLIEQSPLLRDQVARDTETTIELKSNVAIEVGTASARTLRGYSCPLVILDELAFFDVAADAADADESIITALLPSLATIPGSMLLGISSPYARRGVLWDRYQRYWSKNGEPVQVYRAPTAQLNPTVPQALIDAALEKDPAAGQAEWLAMFRQDRDTFVSREIVNQCTAKGVFERAPQPGTNYVGFVDPAGGAGADSMCLAIAHGDRAGNAVLDCTITRRPPFNAENVIAEMALWLKKYRILTVSGDHFSGAIIGDMFRKVGISYTIYPQPKRELFRALLPMMTSGKVELTDNTALQDQLIALERQVSRGGLETITHPLGGHDDVAVAAAGALVSAMSAGFKSWMTRLGPITVGAPTAAGSAATYDPLAPMHNDGGGFTIDPWPSSGGMPGGSTFGP